MLAGRGRSCFPGETGYSRPAGRHSGARSRPSVSSIENPDRRAAIGRRGATSVHRPVPLSDDDPPHSARSTPRSSPGIQGEVGLLEAGSPLFAHSSTAAWQAARAARNFRRTGKLSPDGTTPTADNSHTADFIGTGSGFAQSVCAGLTGVRTVGRMDAYEQSQANISHASRILTGTGSVADGGFLPAWPVGRQRV